MGGWIELRGLDDAQSLRVDVGGLYSATFDDPASEIATGYITGLSGGDDVEIRQPADAADPSVVLTLAAPTIDAAAGSVFGTVPAGTSGEVITDGSCGRERETHSGVAGSFAFPYAGFDPGVFQTVIATDASGNTTALTSAAAGETPCFQVNASASPRSFAVAATHLTGTTLETSRLVLLREGAPLLLDVTGDGTGAGGTPAERPRAGDELLLYIPADALAPTYVVPLPSLSAGFDTLTDLVTVTAPAASRLRAQPAGAVNFRALSDVAEGQNQLDFAAPDDGFPAFDLTGAGVAVDFANTTHTLEYVVDAARTDLPVVPAAPAAPVQSLSADLKVKFAAPGRIRLASLLKRGLRLKFSASAGGGVAFALRIGSSKIAAGSARTRAGTGAVKLRLSSSGRRLLKKLAAKGRGFKQRKATITAIVTDRSGRSRTLRRPTTIRR